MSFAGRLALSVCALQYRNPQSASNDDVKSVYRRADGFEGATLSLPFSFWQMSVPRRSKTR
jgi:hypothetical protein